MRSRSGHVGPFRVIPLVLWVVLGCFAGAGDLAAFDAPLEKTSYLGMRRFKLQLGLSGGGLISDLGINNDGFGLGGRFGMGYSLTRRLHFEFLYQLNISPFESPDPLSTGVLNTDMVLHSEVLRTTYRFDAFAIAPYVGLGIGLYQLGAVSARTGLDFNNRVQMPLTLGVETYVLRDRLSLALEYNYHILFDEKQDSGVLSLLRAQEISFDVHTLTLLLSWHLF